MKRKYVELSMEDVLARLKDMPMPKRRHISDSEIDFSDFPELTPEQLKNARRIGRPLIGSAPRINVHIRIDPDVLRKIKEKAKKKGIKYQSLINEILKKAV